MVEIHDTDVLILGSGLAGLRAALSVFQTDPNLRITIVSTRNGPSGSSFANRNNCLGMQVCFDLAEQNALIRTVKTLAHPGFIKEPLVRILAEESPERFEDLIRLGLKFRRHENGQWIRYPACFSPDNRRALVFDDLGHAHNCFRTALDPARITWIHGHVLTLIQETAGEKILGAAGMLAGRDARFAVQAPMTIVALGGPAGVFRYHLGSPDATGWSYGLLHAVGVPVVNSSFLQIMWANVHDKTFFPIHSLANPGSGLGPDRIPLPESVARLATARAAHCPYGHGLPDSHLDHLLANYLLSDGSVEVSAGGLTQRIAPMVHAGNGGALIDENGRTCLPGLYACGECATGMHGANRIGGAMVLATQVFGHRAGVHAAQNIGKTPALGKKTFTCLTNKICDTHFSALTQPVQNVPTAEWIMTNNNYPGIDNKQHVGVRRCAFDREIRETNLAAISRELIVRHHQSLSK